MFGVDVVIKFRITLGLLQMKCRYCKKETNKKTRICPECKEKIYKKHTEDERIKKHLTIRMEEAIEDVENQSNGLK